MNKKNLFNHIFFQISATFLLKIHLLYKRTAFFLYNKRIKRKLHTQIQLPGDSG